MRNTFFNVFATYTLRVTVRVCSIGGFEGSEIVVMAPHLLWKVKEPVKNAELSALLAAAEMVQKKVFGVVIAGAPQTTDLVPL